VLLRADERTTSKLLSLPRRAPVVGAARWFSAPGRQVTPGRWRGYHRSGMALLSGGTYMMKRSRSPSHSITPDEWLTDVGRNALHAALRLCCVPVDTVDHRQGGRNTRGGLVLYLDGMSEDVVQRQLQFRKSRNHERSSSRTSLNSLDSVSEDTTPSPYHSWPKWDHSLRRNMSTPALGRDSARRVLAM